ncbi:MAG TPA: nucleotide disphospho-sugar-binding domain-containing protein [Edaphobacter sp.]|nr:nucleotide disphospho-sugar-binding domain-containing protein [Edaphobacter sp.]
MQPTQRPHGSDSGFAGGILNILFVAEGTAGDVNPLLGLSSVFASQGHSVSFLANAVFADVVEGCGLRFVPTGTAESYRALRDRAAGSNALQLSKLLWKSLIDSVRPVFDALVSEVDDNTVIAAHPWVLGARLVQEKHGVPMVTVHISPATLLSAKLPPLHRPFPVPLWLPYSVRSGLIWALERGVLDRILGPDINRLRYELGLPKVNRIVGRWMHSPQGVLGLFPDWFAPPQTDWPPGVSLTGFPQFDQGNLRRIDPETEEFLAKPIRPVVFTVGSTSTDEISYYAAAAAAVNALGLRAIFLTNQELPPLGPNVLVRSYVPLSRLLSSARAIVHHGGTGTVSHALAAGIPQLITPFVFDQFDNAVRIERLGCGMKIDSGTLARTMWPGLQRLLESVEIQQNCTMLRSRVDSGPAACRRAVAVIEEAASQARRA